jgi:hypothetical protein
MAYNDTPLANEAKNTSQPRIRNNFNVLQSFLALNHEDPDTGTGKHSFVTLPVHAAPVTANGEAAVYTKTVNAHSEPYFVRDNVIADELPLSTVFNHVQATLNYAILPGGLKLRWGYAQTGAMPNAEIDINLNAAPVPAEARFTQVPVVILTRQHTGLGLAAEASAHTNRGVYVENNTYAAPNCTMHIVSFTTASSNTKEPNVNFNYLAIGI